MSDSSPAIRHALAQRRSSSPAIPPARFGQYEVLGRLGQGGMSEVLEARHVALGTRVAIKVMHTAFEPDDAAARRIVREGRAAATVRHPHVVSMLDVGVQDGTAYLVEELLEGESLAECLARRGPLPASEIADLLLPIISGMSALHAAGVIHGDLKPSNVLLAKRHHTIEPVVVDFGISRRARQADASVTVSHAGAGSVLYMAPEQVRGGARLTEKTDQYALGVIAYECATGGTPFADDDRYELLHAIMTAPVVRPSELDPAIPGGFDVAILRALERDADRRFAHVRDLGTALLPFASERARAMWSAELGGVTSTVAPAAVSRGRRSLHIAGVVALAAAAAVLARGRLADLVSARAGAPAGSAPAPTAERHAPVADLASPGTSPVPGAALLDYRAGIQLWRDASLDDALEKLGAAAAAAPAFAAAHLWCVFATGYATSESRAHYASAVTYRSALSGPQIELLEAYRPAMEDPPDYATATRNLGRLAARYPESVEVAVARARALARMGNAAAAEDVLAALSGESSALGIVLYVRSGLASLGADADRELALLETCAEGSPTATSCLFVQWQLTAAEGRCPELEPICRRITSRAPDSPEGYQCLADALYSTGAPSAEIGAAYAEAYKRMDSDDVAVARAQDDVWLAAAAGRLEDAAAGAKSWIDLAASASAGPDERTSAYEAYVALEIELGQRDRAARAAREMVASARSWPRTSHVDLDATGIFLRSASGDLDAAERGPLRARVLAAAAAPSYGSPLRRWYNGYAATTWTREEAVEAIANVPSPLPPLQASDDDYLFARVFALVGDEARAASHFARASRSCGVHDDFYRTKAKLEWAIRSEARREVACPLYRDVARHWGGSARSTTAIRAVARAGALGCPPASTRP